MIDLLDYVLVMKLPTCSILYPCPFNPSARRTDTAPPNEWPVIDSDLEKECVHEEKMRVSKNVGEVKTTSVLMW